MVVISVFWLGWALLRSSLRRSKRRRIEAKEAAAAAEASRAEEQKRLQDEFATREQALIEGSVRTRARRPSPWWRDQRATTTGPPVAEDTAPATDDDPCDRVDDACDGVDAAGDRIDTRIDGGPHARVLGSRPAPGRPPGLTATSPALRRFGVDDTRPGTRRHECRQPPPSR